MHQSLRILLIASFVIAVLAGSASAQDARIPLDWEPVPNDKSHPVVIWHGCKAKIVKLIGGRQIRDRSLATGLSRQQRPAPGNTVIDRRMYELPPAGYPVFRTLPEEIAPPTGR